MVPKHEEVFEGQNLLLSKIGPKSDPENMFSKGGLCSLVTPPFGGRPPFGRPVVFALSRLAAQGRCWRPAAACGWPLLAAGPPAGAADRTERVCGFSLNPLVGQSILAVSDRRSQTAEVI
jgi:hypothetical protein